jgi:5'-nucleotidase
MILITNDDGIQAEGLACLVKAVSGLDEVMIVAPDGQRSAIGHGITIDKTISAKRVALTDGTTAYAISGTPADCVKIALTALCQEPPRLVISGINLGPNAGVNVFYSGTVSAALEGAILGIQSFAISLATFVNPLFEAAAAFSRQLASILLAEELPKGVVLNVNVPNLPSESIAGVAFTRQGHGKYGDLYELVADDGSDLCFKLVGEAYEPDEAADCDDQSLLGSMISVTPLHLDLTSLAWLPQIGVRLKQQLTTSPLTLEPNFCGRK